MAVEKMQYCGYGNCISKKNGQKYYMIYFHGQTFVNEVYDSADTPRISVFVTQEEQMAFRKSHNFKDFCNVFYKVSGNRVNYSLTE